jgi:MFS family permease
LNLNCYFKRSLSFFLKAWIGSTSNGFQFLASIPSSLLVDLFRPRLIGILGGILSTLALALCALVRRIECYFITFSILFGFGQSLLLISTFAILPHYFNKKIGLANGLMNMGASLITITVPILIGECLNKLGLELTWFVLAGLCFVTILCALAFKPLLPKKCLKNECEKIRETFGVEILTNYKFLNWSVACFLGIGGSMIPLLTMVSYFNFFF